MAKSVVKRIGILGGAFDPVHLGHLMMAENAAEAFGLDQVIFVVASHSPFKQQEAISSKHRLGMVKAAIKGNPKLSVSDLELRRGGVSYTIDTLGYFKAKNPQAELYLIIGEDNVSGLSKWKDIEAIRGLANFIVVERDWFNVSSTLIRAKLKQKKSVRYLTPDSVISYISRHKLYS